MESFKAPATKAQISTFHLGDIRMTMNKVMATKSKAAKAAVKKLPKEVSVEAAAEAKLLAENGHHAQGGFSTNVVADDASGGGNGGVSPVVILGGLVAAGGIAAAAAGGGGEKVIVQPVPTPVPAPTPAPVPAPVYTVTAAATSVDEGSTIRFTISGTNAAGKVVSYQLTGSAATAADTSTPLTGTVTLDSNGKAYVDVVVSADKLTEGAEKLNLVLSGGEKVAADVTVNDTSLTPPPAAQTFTLTTSVDVSGELKGDLDTTSTDGNDIFKATESTLTAGDRLDGGVGSDKLAITTTAAAALGTSVVSKGIETVEINATNGAVSLDAAQFTGVTAVTNQASVAGADVTVTGLAAIPTVNLIANNNANTTVSFAANLVNGAADAVSVNLNGANVGASGTLTINGVETFNVTSSGSASGSATTAVTLTSDALTTLNVSGSAAAKIKAELVGATATTTGVVTSDGGAHDIEITAQSTDKLDVKLGGGNDTLRISNIAATHTLSGGEGTDTLRTSASISTVTGANVSDFEAITTGSAVTVALDVTKNKIATLTVVDAVTATVTGFEDAGTVNLAVTGAGAVVTNATGWTGTANTLTVNAGLGTTTGAFSGTVTADGIETVTVKSVAAGSDTSARTYTVSGDALKTLVVSSAGAATIAGGSTTLTKIDASGVAGDITLTATRATAGAEVIGGAGNDAFTGGAGADTLTGGAGNDVLTGGAGNDVLSGGDGADRLTGGTGRDALTGGAGADTFVFSANAADALVSSSTTIDNITDFTSGTDKLDVGASSFLGVFSTVQQALAANAVAGTPDRSAAFVSGENTLYVFTTGGVNALNVLDTVIKLDNVTTITAADLLIGAQGSGNAITVTAAAASVTTAAATNARATTAGTNTPVDAATTTAFDDTVSANVSYLVGSTLTGGLGNDTLALSLSTLGGGAVADTVNITGFERLTLGNFTPSSTQANQSYDITLSAATVAANSTLTVVSSYAGLQADGFTTGNMAFSAAALGATSKLNFTGAAANDSVTGGAGADTINGGNGNDTISGGLGNDVLNGDAGNDNITTGAGDDVVDGGSGNDTIVLGTNLTSADTISGGTGNDTLTVTAPSGGPAATAFDNVTGVENINFTVDSTAANNVVTVTAASAFALDTAAVSFTALGATAANLNFAALERGISVTGGSGADTITGGAGADVITGGDGADNLVGGAGNDTFVISLAAHFASGETISGGAGSGDTINYTPAAAGTTLALSALVTGVENVNIIPTTSTDGAALDASLVLTGLNITGGGGNDTVTGTALDDTISGGAGADVIDGGDGADSIVGGAGNDALTGGAGNDTISGGEGVDVITPGAGINSVVLTETTAAIDTVVLTHAGAGNVTTITGFAVANDVIKLTEGNITPTGRTGNFTLSGTKGDDITSSTTQVFATVAQNGGTVDQSGVNGVVKFTTGASSFGAAIGTSSVTVAAVGVTELVSALWYDSANGQMVIGAIDANSDGNGANITQNDTFYEMGRVTMSASDYAALGIASLTFG